ncbi:MAG: hypothetical protein RL291_1606, partial [Pseudomonadota bacterium]
MGSTLRAAGFKATRPVVVGIAALFSLGALSEVWANEPAPAAAPGAPVAPASTTSAAPTGSRTSLDLFLDRLMIAESG